MRVFNSSEPYEVLEGNGARVLQFTVKPNEKAHLIMTRPPNSKPCFDVYRIAGRVSDCQPQCGNCNKEVTQLVDTLTKDNPTIAILLPGDYYLHTEEAKWMDDPCSPVIVEAIIAAHT